MPDRTFVLYLQLKTLITMRTPEQVREMIIEKSAVLFNKKGIVGTSISDIIKETKVAKASLYGHFENKEALARATVDYLSAKIGKQTDYLISREKTAKLKIAAFMELYKNPVNAPFIEGGCPMLNFGVDSDDTDVIIRKKVCASADTMLTTLETIISDGVAAGELLPTINPEVQALKILAVMEGAMLLSKVMDSNKKMQTLTKMVVSEIEMYEIS